MQLTLSIITYDQGTMYKRECQILRYFEIFAYKGDKLLNMKGNILLANYKGACR